MCTGTFFLILAIAGLFTQFPCWSSKLSKVSVMIAESRTVVLQFHCLVIVCEFFLKVINRALSLLHPVQMDQHIFSF